MMPKKLLIKDLAKSFKVGDIIDTQKRRAVSFEDLSADLKNVKIVYIGEKHTDLIHHNIQLDIIKKLFSEDKNLIVGMEAFAQTYQHILDMWSAGILDEKEFLEKTHWYANWKFDFELYKDILNFVKEKHIKLVGLNMDFHIPPKIAVGGLDSLPDGEKKQLPRIIDMDNVAHRVYVEEIFKKHKIRGRENFEYFYMTQCVWEEKMAEVISRYFKNEKMVVLTGNGHIVYKFGIPDRVFTRTRAPFKTIYLLPAGNEAELSFADYIRITPEIKKHGMGHVKSGKIKPQSHHPVSGKN
jgi:uncharacterized iron-regulated protein